MEPQAHAFHPGVSSALGSRALWQLQLTNLLTSHSSYSNSLYPLEMSCKPRNTLNILLIAISLDCYGKSFQVSRLPDKTGHPKPVTRTGFPSTDEKTGTQQLDSCFSAVGGIAGLKWSNWDQNPMASLLDYTVTHNSKPVLVWTPWGNKPKEVLFHIPVSPAWYGWQRPQGFLPWPQFITERAIYLCLILESIFHPFR